MHNSDHAEYMLESFGWFSSVLIEFICAAITFQIQNKMKNISVQFEFPTFPHWPRNFSHANNSKKYFFMWVAIFFRNVIFENTLWVFCIDSRSWKIISVWKSKRNPSLYYRIQPFDLSQQKDTSLQQSLDIRLDHEHPKSHLKWRSTCIFSPLDL